MSGYAAVVAAIAQLIAYAMEAFSKDFDTIMADLKQRTSVDGSASDAAAKEMDSHLPE